LVQLSDRGYPAYADFHGRGGPAKGMLLARSSGGGENPMAEYAVGKGRIIVMGWRLPHYSYAANPHRANLERLTANTLAYLANEKAWRKIVLVPVNAPRGRKPAAPQIAWAAPALSDTTRAALGRAITDLTETHGNKYPRGAEFAKRLDAVKTDAEFHALRREALLANPLLDFGAVLLVRRTEGKMGLPRNWQSNSCLPKNGYDNELAVLTLADGAMKSLYRPEGGRFLGDVDLHWDGARVLFSMPGANGRWQIHEMKTDGSGLRELPLILEKDVDNYDACYLPNGNVMFTSTAPFVGVPCVKGSSHVSNMYLLDTKGAIRRLTFEQDHDWCPTVLNNGRVLYLRWEYSDIPHYVSRILFHMNPDGTEQMEYYGSNSYWPNSTFFARPVPGHPTRFVGVVSGHHDTSRMGELVLFDPAKGRREADGVVQRIPGWGKKVEPIIADGLVSRSWPKFLHPWPLGGNYFLVSCKPGPRSRWGLYLVDVFDNFVLLKEDPTHALIEAVPLAKRTRPPVIPDKVDPKATEATITIADIYVGDGLRGVPRGAVKKLRLFTYHFAYHGMGGQVNRVGLDGPWDVKRIVGTVPVEADGSANFRVPANLPISAQPLDAEGKALQLMRSWMTAMPGETLSCVGCHESQNASPPTRRAMALTKPPAAITPWYGPIRGFDFTREVQPVLDAHCVRCHDEKTAPDLRDLPPVEAAIKKGGYKSGTKFPPSYIALRSFVRAHTIESDMHMLNPGEFHADTTRLVQLLREGHYDVQLDAEGWDRLITWIDLNTPAHGTWTDVVGEKKVTHQRDRRRAMMMKYCVARDEDPETVYAADYKPKPAKPVPVPAKPANPKVAGWPFSADAAKKRQVALGQATRKIELDGLALELVRVPAGEFPMGGKSVKVDKPFWMGAGEVTNEQFAKFDPTHDSRIEHGDFLQFGVRERGYPVNGSQQPVCRVSWNMATAYCRWLSGKTGETITLPTEAQWEWACRAGAATPLWYGALDADFSKAANLADHTLRYMDTFGWGLPSGAVPAWRPAVETVKDGHHVSAPVKSFQPNPWGLHDMHGNVAEWTSSDAAVAGRKIVRGGSWYDLPARATSSFRQRYPAWMGVYDVGFRVICLPAAKVTRR
ncbi:SUMF1/EgtB/PvdO family nonheme iron enzyme, partial [bacterium]|nr:SUMF1/EgtB/PvdO family nonheme iron enzyme [bacterium]